MLFEVFFLNLVEDNNDKVRQVWMLKSEIGAAAENVIKCIASKVKRYW